MSDLSMDTLAGCVGPTRLGSLGSGSLPSKASAVGDGESTDIDIILDVRENSKAREVKLCAETDERVSLPGVSTCTSYAATDAQAGELLQSLKLNIAYSERQLCALPEAPPLLTQSYWQTKDKAGQMVRGFAGYVLVAFREVLLEEQEKELCA